MDEDLLFLLKISLTLGPNCVLSNLPVVIFYIENTAINVEL
jgi:hypothetical protein